MSGKIELKVRKSIPKRKDLKYYPGWVWQITGEDNRKTNIMPSWLDMEKAIEDTILHEVKVDRVTGRNPDTQRYQQFLKTLVKKCESLQTKIIDFAEIEKIYTECKR